MKFLHALVMDHQEDPTFFDYTLRTETPFPLLWKAVKTERPDKKVVEKKEAK